MLKKYLSTVIINVLEVEQIKLAHKTSLKLKLSLFLPTSSTSTEWNRRQCIYNLNCR